MESFTLRAAATTDVPAIQQIAAECSLEAWSSTAYLQELKSAESSLFVAATLDGEAFAFIAGRIVPGVGDGLPDAEIHNIGVANRRRRSGVAAALLALFFDRCRRRNVGTVWLEVRASNAGAIAFYEESGFRSVGVRKGFYRTPSDDAVLMRLGLNESGR
jgi:ribosomal-protein-alanine acetyltransferase